jgi:hypothetical protein
MPSHWIEHVKEFAKKHKMSYSSALKDPKVKKGYKPVGDKKPKPKKMDMGMPAMEPKEKMM